MCQRKVLESKEKNPILKILQIWQREIALSNQYKKIFTMGENGVRAKQIIVVDKFGTVSRAKQALKNHQ